MFAIQLQYIAIFDQDDIFFGVTEMILHKLLVSKQHAVLTVNGHDKFWPDSFSHDANVLLRSVPTNMNQPPFFLNDVCAALIQESDHPRNSPFIARNDASREDHCVTILNSH